MSRQFMQIIETQQNISSSSFVELGLLVSPVLEPPWSIKVGKNSRSPNQPYARKLAPVLDDWIFAGQ